MSISYVKMSGAGNIFIVADAKNVPSDADPAEIALRVCDPSNSGGGADGLIVIDRPDDDGTDFAMRYFNRDGSTGMMCGNGGRCAVRFAVDHGYTGTDSPVIFTNAGIRYRAECTDNGVRVYFPEPRLFKLKFRLNILGDMRTCHYADVGTPHAVMFVDEMGDRRLRHVSQLDLNVWGKALRHHPDFQPGGVNANFAEVLPENTGVLLRTFERGVEAETGACGTGAISVGILAHVLRGVPLPVSVTVTSGATLRVDFGMNDGHISNLSLEGGAEYLTD